MKGEQGGSVADALYSCECGHGVTSNAGGVALVADVSGTKEMPKPIIGNGWIRRRCDVDARQNPSKEKSRKYQLGLLVLS